MADHRSASKMAIKRKEAPTTQMETNKLPKLEAKLLTPPIAKLKESQEEASFLQQRTATVSRSGLFFPYYHNGSEDDIDEATEELQRRVAQLEQELAEETERHPTNIYWYQKKI
eukprot:TRINITY_DN836_c1_g1_i4.p2 TRINITY_DN836_c1_g1~~TRINITY_DN836_c1_g1_i4.p2  ORF type:complete len:114 (+),score=28.93 TRINITY_DN836_c1_g1_i4:1030-1371(+)